jgi:hypothetical protein
MDVLVIMVFSRFVEKTYENTQILIPNGMQGYPTKIIGFSVPGSLFLSAHGLVLSFNCHIRLLHCRSLQERVRVFMHDLAVTRRGRRRRALTLLILKTLLLPGDSGVAIL